MQAKAPIKKIGLLSALFCLALAALVFSCGPALLNTNKRHCLGTPPTAYHSRGGGTRADPYLICNANQLAHLSQSSAGWSKHYKLMNDLDMSGHLAATYAP